MAIFKKHYFLAVKDYQDDDGFVFRVSDTKVVTYDSSTEEDPDTLLDDFAGVFIPLNGQDFTDPNTGHTMKLPNINQKPEHLGITLTVEHDNE